MGFSADKQNMLPIREWAALRERKGNAMRLRGNKVILCVYVVGLLLVLYTFNGLKKK